MAIATGTAIAIGAGLAAGTSVYGAKKSADAAKNAAAQQQAGVREARAYGEPLYAEAQRMAAEQLSRGQAGLAPYAQQGQQGLTALSALMGLPATSAAPASAFLPSPRPPAPPAPITSASYPRPSNDTMRQVQGQTGMSFEQALGQGLIDPQGRPTGATAASASSYVTLRAPTGETKQVPADQAGYYLARGAARV